MCRSNERLSGIPASPCQAACMHARVNARTHNCLVRKGNNATNVTLLLCPRLIVEQVKLMNPFGYELLLLSKKRRTWLQATKGKHRLSDRGAAAAARGECESTEPYGIPESYQSFGAMWKEEACVDNYLIR